MFLFLSLNQPLLRLWHDLRVSPVLPLWCSSLLPFIASQCASHRCTHWPRSALECRWTFPKILSLKVQECLCAPSFSLVCVLILCFQTNTFFFSFPLYIFFWLCLHLCCSVVNTTICFCSLAAICKNLLDLCYSCLLNPPCLFIPWLKTSSLHSDWIVKIFAACMTEDV